MARLGLANILFLYVLIYLKIVSSTTGTSVIQSVDATQSTSGNSNLNGGSASTPKVNAEDGSSKEVTTNPSSLLDQSKIKIFYQDPNDASETIECESTMYKAKKQGDVIDYELKDGSKCVKIEYDNNEVWKYDSSVGSDGYPELVVAYLGTKTIFVDLKKVLNVFQHHNNQWKSIFSGEPKHIQLNTKSKKSSDVFDYEKSDKIHTYTPKGNFIFNDVMTGDKDIWDTEDFTEYANKVVYDTSNSSNKIVTIHQLNGLMKTYTKKPKKYLWHKCRYEHFPWRLSLFGLTR